MIINQSEDKRFESVWSDVCSRQMRYVPVKW